MKIEWLGHSTFKVSGENISIVHDPYKNILGYKLPKDLTADIVLSSHGHGDHSNKDGVNGTFDFINTLGTHESNGLKIESIKSFHDNQGGAKKGENIIFKYKLDGVTIAHLGDLGHILNEEQQVFLNNVDIMFVPCGGGFTVGSSDASTVVEQVQPKIVIPMHYRTKALYVFGFKFEKVDNLINLLDRKVIKQKSLEITQEQIKTENAIVILDYK